MLTFFLLLVIVLGAMSIGCWMNSRTTDTAIVTANILRELTYIVLATTLLVFK